MDLKKKKPGNAHFGRRFDLFLDILSLDIIRCLFRSFYLLVN